jgi:lipopolysaccharide cholinephosphotransferase
MPRKDYEHFLQIAPTMLGANYHLVSWHNEPKAWPNSFANVFKRNTLCIREQPATSYGGSKNWEIGIDIFPYDNAFYCKPLLQFQRYSYIVWKLLWHYKTNPAVHSPLATIGRILAAPFPVKTIQHFREIPLRFMEPLLLKNPKYVVQWVGTGSWMEELYPREMLFPLDTKVEFEGKTYAAPHDADAMLRHFYGDYMQLPPPEKRENHNMDTIIFDTRLEGNGKFNG